MKNRTISVEIIGGAETLVFTDGEIKTFFVNGIPRAQLKRGVLIINTDNLYINTIAGIRHSRIALQPVDYFQTK